MNDSLSALQAALVAAGQEHLFPKGQTPADAAAVLSQLESLQYPGGVLTYVANAKRLLHEDQQKKSSTTTSASTNNTNGAAQEAPMVVKIEPPLPQDVTVFNSIVHCGDAALLQEEQSGRTALKDNIFVLVAGGLGERLGYGGIKVGLPVETATYTTYLEHYLRWAAAVGRCPLGGHNHGSAAATMHYGGLPTMMPPLEARQNPFIIMTSAASHRPTIALLEQHRFFGYDRERVFVVQQDTVPCLQDPQGRIAVAEDGRTILRKPHGHGDVHHLLWELRQPTFSAVGGSGKKHQQQRQQVVEGPVGLPDDAAASGARGGSAERLLEAWLSLDSPVEGPYRSITFMQDTNAAATSTIPLALHTMRRKEHAMCFTCVPRLPGESIGVFCRQVGQDGTVRSGNVEYNVFAETLQRCGGGADTVDPATGFSPFPGSINTLLLSLDAYVAALRRTGGAVPEFVNPKYVDPATKAAFKSPTRVESLMQDIAYALQGPNGTTPSRSSTSSTSLVGCCVFGRDTYEPVKNGLAAGIDAFAERSIAPHVAASAEQSFLILNRARFAFAGVQFTDDVPKLPPVTVISPANACRTLNISLFPIIAHDATFCDGSMTSLLRSLGKGGDEEEASLHGSGMLKPPKSALGGAAAAACGDTPSVRISQRSVLIVKGNVTIKSLVLDGALVIDASSCPGAHVTVDGLEVRNASWTAVPILPDADGAAAAAGRPLEPCDWIRGYVLARVETMRYPFDHPGHFHLGGNDTCCYVPTPKPTSSNL